MLVVISLDALAIGAAPRENMVPAWPWARPVTATKLS